MPQATRSMLSALVVACFCCQSVLAQEVGSRWWPFSRQRNSESPTAPTPVQPQATDQHAPPNSSGSSAEVERPWLFESPFAKISWPEFRLPEVSLPKPRMPQFWPSKAQLDDTRNAWAGQYPEPEPSSPLQAVRDGAQRVSDSTRAAWRKTVNTLTPGDDAGAPSSPRVASRGAGGTFWKRMLSPEPAPSPQGPRTMSEWVGQERVN
jgi:hypothetical protein